MNWIFVDELTNEQALEFSCEYFKKISISNPSGRTSQEAYPDEEDIEKRSKVIAKRIVEIKSKIQNNILDMFYNSSLDDSHRFKDSDEDSSLKLSGLDKDEARLESRPSVVSQEFKTTHTLDIPVSTNFNSKYRYILFNEMIKYLYTYLSSSLLIKRNYFESLVTKTNDLSTFYSATHTKKKMLHSKNLEISLELLDYKERIDKINAQIKDKQSTLASQIQEMKEYEQEKKQGKGAGQGKYRGFMSSTADINFTEKAIKDLEEELSRLILRHDEIKQSLGSLEEIISDTEISNVRSAQILNSITDNAQIAKTKLESVKKRIKNLLGDSIILA